MMMGSTRIRIAAMASSLGVALLFVLAPGIDIWFSDLFFQEGAGFYLRDAAWVGLLYDMVHPLTVVLVLVLLGLLIYNLVRRPVGPFDTRAVLFMLAVLALGPGLVVNAVFKEHWGRARPRDITEFGGTRTFTPAFVISDQCERNCSFVSGHASLPFAFAALGFLLRRRRWAIYAGAAAFGGLVGFGRIVQGAHFLSDVVFSGVFVFLVAYLLAHYVFRLEAVGVSENA
ncbi:MAG: phosphatase PAP2 family protein [Gemmatimonadales bacterium]|jgi:lipid A 4'-phosphatase